jgi:hypothetical protein
MTWLLFALLTVVSWGVYGVFLHTGQTSMGGGGYTAKGMTWSLIAGVAGAIGAFGVLLAFGAGGKPGVVMSIVFAGAPVVNAVYSLYLHPPAGGLSKVPAPFYLGILLAAFGGFLVTYFKPAPSAAKPKPVQTTSAAAPSQVR